MIWFAPDRKTAGYDIGCTALFVSWRMEMERALPKSGTAALERRLGGMTSTDDIPLDSPPSQTGRAITPKDGGSRRKVGPESEVRGGPEATDERLDDPEGHRTPR